MGIITYDDTFFLHFTTKVQLQKYIFFTKHTNFTTIFLIIIVFFGIITFFVHLYSLSSEKITIFAGSNKEVAPSLLHRCSIAAPSIRWKNDGRLMVQ
jgi:hypothetical protein